MVLPCINSDTKRRSVLNRKSLPISKLASGDTADQELFRKTRRQLGKLSHRNADRLSFLAGTGEFSLTQPGDEPLTRVTNIDREMLTRMPIQHFVLAGPRPCCVASKTMKRMHSAVLAMSAAVLLSCTACSSDA